MEERLIVRTLGAFTVMREGRTISDSSARSYKVWKIFKYLVTNRHKMLSTEALIDIIWPDEQPANPLKSLHAIMFRLRKLLDRNGDSESCILSMHNSYQWNLDAPIDLDVANFETLVHYAREESSDERKKPYLEEAVKWYKGDYLHDSSSEIWAQPATYYYKRMYVNAVTELIEIYTRDSAYNDIVKLCNTALQIEPYEEALHEYFIQALLISGDTEQAHKQYRLIADKMHRQFGSKPSELLQSLYQEIQNREHKYAFDPLTIKQRLEKEDARRGAYFCTAEMFRQIYQLDMRSNERMKFPVFFAVITVVAKKPGMDVKILETASQILRRILIRTLRKGDIITQYAKYQYLLLLSLYMPEDAQSVLVRIKRLFADEACGGYCELQTNISRIGEIRPGDGEIPVTYESGQA